MRVEGVVGCSDGGCMWGHPGGMHTNGGCNCERTLQRDVGVERQRAISRNVRTLRAEVERLRGRKTVTLTAGALREALELAAPDLSDPDQRASEVTIEWMPARRSTEGEHMPAGYYVYHAEYPEEGVMGPLTGIQQEQSDE